MAWKDNEACPPTPTLEITEETTQDHRQAPKEIKGSNEEFQSSVLSNHMRYPRKLWAWIQEIYQIMLLQEPQHIMVQFEKNGALAEVINTILIFLFSFFYYQVAS